VKRAEALRPRESVPAKAVEQATTGVSVAKLVTGAVLTGVGSPGWC